MGQGALIDHSKFLVVGLANSFDQVAIVLRLWRSELAPDTEERGRIGSVAPADRRHPAEVERNTG